MSDTTPTPEPASAQEHAARPLRFPGPLDWIWLLVWAVASSVWCLAASARLGPTFDEPNYVSNGLESWRSGSYRLLLRQGTMPLPVDVQTLPLYAAENWRGRPFAVGSDAKSRPVETRDLSLVLPWARAANLVFWWLLLFFGWRLGMRFGGLWGGRLAALVLACEPTLLAHATLATTDVALAACLMGLVFFFSRGPRRESQRRRGLSGVWMGLVLLSKASGLLFGPLCVCAIEVERRARRRMVRAGEAAEKIWTRILPRAFWNDLAAILGIGLLIALFYVGSDFRPEPSFVSLADGMRAGPWKNVVTAVARGLRIFPNAAEGLVKQIGHNVRGQGVFLLGSTDPRAFWYYFPVALTMKATLPMLAALFGLALRKPSALKNPANAAAALLVVSSFAYRVQIGIRLLLPVLALLCVGLSVSVARVASVGLRRRRRAALALLAAGVLWTVATPILVWPHGLCFVNELWGGTANGYTKLSDSNFDWGQGLPDLDRWRRERGLAEVDVWYFGSDPAYRTTPFRSIPLQSLPIGTREDLAAQVQGRYLAASTTLLYGAPVSASQERAALLMRSMRPVDRTMTYLIYEFPGKPEEGFRRR